MADVSNYLDIPMFGTCGCTDSKVVDQQAAIEDALSILITAQSGANLNHDVGYIEHGNCASLENLVISNDLIGFARRIVKGIEVNDDTLGLDVIDKVGPGGHFLGEAHTRSISRRRPGILISLRGSFMITGRWKVKKHYWSGVMKRSKIS